MQVWNIAGFIASVLVLTAFCMRQVTSLRAVALTSNLAFLVYGVGLHLAPVWLLHALLLPVNGMRLLQELRSVRVAGSSSSQRADVGRASAPIVMAGEGRPSTSFLAVIDKE
ncbi:MAG TPA: hypothetical protein VH855_21920 [Acetobacteraceae bacterium]|jgi:hypothetical protein